MTGIPTTSPAEILALTASSSPPAATGRTVTGLIVQWDTVGNTSAGPTIFRAGSINLPADLSRVKLLLDHDHSRPIGYMTSAEVTELGILGTFHVPESPLGDRALISARDKVRDGLSVGAQIVDYGFDDADRLVVNASDLNETSLVAIPAFRDSIVSAVTASRKDKIVTRSQLLNIAASAAATGDRPAAGDNDQADDGTSSTSSSTPAEPETDETDETDETGESSSTSSTPAGGVTAAAVRREVVRAARRTSGGRPPMTLSRLAGVIEASVREQGTAAHVNTAITAALSDVTPANIATTDYGPSRPQYVTDLWTAADVDRPLLDAFGTKELKALKVSGFVWETRPTVAKYAGNKAAVPSGAIKRVRKDATAQRFAGGWDIDRVFVDLPNESNEVEDVLTEATKDYKTKSEAYAAELLAAAQTLLYGAAVSVPAALATLGSYFGAVKGSRIDVVQMGTTAWEAFANMTEAEAPWWLKAQGTISLGTSSGTAGGISFVANPDLAAGEILAADTRAATFWEVDPPVKVRAVDVANGGVDVGVFGYMAGLVNDPRLVVNIDTAGRTQA